MNKYPKYFRAAELALLILSALGLAVYLVSFARISSLNGYPFVAGFANTSGVIVSSGTKACGKGGVQAVATYDYFVNGANYRSDTFSLSGFCSRNRAQTEALVAHLPPGASTIVYFNANRPGYATLTRSFPVGATVWGLALCALLVLVVFFANRRIRRFPKVSGV